MSLTETLAWIGSQDMKLANAAHRFLYEMRHSGSAWSFTAAQLLSADLEQLYGTRLADAERDLTEAAAGGKLSALARFDGAAYETMPAEAWVDTRIQYYQDPTLCGGKLASTG